jgi:hypothetical protein
MLATAAFVVAMIANGQVATDPVNLAPVDVGVVTIDASRLNSVIALNAPWRFHAGDDITFADPGLDDGAWPLVQPAQRRLLSASQIAPVPDGKDWLRLHLHLLNAQTPLAISIMARNGTPYCVYANGRLIGASAHFGEDHPASSRPFVITLPQENEIVLAVRFVTRGKLAAHFVPLEQIELGPSQDIGNKIDLERYRTFEGNGLLNVALAVVYLACVPFGLALFFAQRNHSEYSWLATVFCLEGFSFLVESFSSTYGFPNKISICIYYFVEAAGTIAWLELILVMAGGRHRSIVRAVQSVRLAATALNVLLQFSFPVLGLTLFFGWSMPFVILTLSGYLLLSAYFRGNRECGFLFFPVVLIPLAGVKESVDYFYPAFLGPNWMGHLGGVGFTALQISSLLFLAGVLAVVLHRFIRVSKDEQLAAAELEAARAVQQLLIPATQPDTPGFTVESVYLPARLVGGDFFLVLPSTDATERSVLAVMGDVSGKGLQAAMVVSTIMGGLRMQLSRQPAEVLGHLNRMLVGHISGFATCCVALIHQDGTVLIANAGNPAPYAAGEEVPTMPGLPLGLAAEVVYEQTNYILAPTAALTFVSDGVIEAAANDRELFGFERTQNISQESAGAIAAAVLSFSAGAPQGDDITILTLSRK